MKKFNKPNLHKLRAKINAALSGVAKDCGIAIVVGRISYDSQNATIKVEASTVVDGEVQSKEVTDFKLYATRYGFKPEDLGREFIAQGSIAKGRKCYIKGLLPRRHKYPILCGVVGTDEKFILSVPHVKRLLGIEVDTEEIPDPVFLN